MLRPVLAIDRRLRAAAFVSPALIAVLLAACADETPTGVRPRSLQALPLITTGVPVSISQAYGGGGNSGAPYRNDFIELYNRGTTAIDLTGWSVQYAATTGTNWSVTTLSGSIAPGSYYLVQEAAGSNVSAPALPTPDATGTIAMALGAGR